ncbi:Sucraseferredoxin-like protein [Amylocystis lapponica]|nr:Sucraseferredoxin-like protein [Amylocystis lapponica]
MSTIRWFKAYMLGEQNSPAPEGLRAASVPVSEADCRSCANPCDEGHDEYPKFDVDMESQILGSMKPYARQLVISTGKSDWEKEVTDAPNSLALYLSEQSHRGRGGGKERDRKDRKDRGDKVRGERPHRDKDGERKPRLSDASIPGLYDPSTTSKVAILNGSHNTVCDDTLEETVLVLPDYKVVVGVQRTPEGAEEFWTHVADPSLPRAASTTAETRLKSWVLPYSCVILLCSHKRRDNRCAISAPKLEHGFTTALERQGWDVRTQLEDPAQTGPALEELSGTEEEREAEIVRQLHAVDPVHADHPSALILRNSHIGGHKFAGNVIIYTPQGVAVWYGRVTPHEVEAVVKETIIGGKILPPLLRGGLNLARPGRTTLHDW